MFYIIKNRILYSFILLSLLLLAVILRQSFFVLALLLFFALPFISYLLTNNTFKKLDCSINSKFHIGQAPWDTKLAITLSNPTPIPLLHLEVELYITSLFYENLNKEIIILPIYSRNSNKTVFPINFHKIGCYNIEIKSIKTYDFLHMFSFVRETNNNLEIKILPSYTKTEQDFDFVHSESFDEFEEASAKQTINNDFSDIREYIPGDRLQRIHWKLTAKLDELMVKETLSSASNCFIVLIDFYRGNLDKNLEQGYCLCKDLINQQETVYLSVYSQAKETFLFFPLINAEQLDMTYESIFYEQPYDTEDFALELYQKANIKKGTLLYISQKGISHVQ